MEITALKKDLTEEKALLIDVREDDEWQSGHIIGAIHFPMSKLVNFHLFDTLPKDKTLYIYCASGKRAKLAERLLAPYVAHVEALPFGFCDLKNHGFPAE